MSVSCKQEFLGERWVDELGDAWRKETLEFEEATHNVALKLLRAFAIALGRPENYFAEVRIQPFTQSRQNVEILSARGFWQCFSEFASVN